MLRTKLPIVVGAVLVVTALLTAAAPAGAPLAQGRVAGRDPRAELFIRRGCSACHAISGLGVSASSDVAPDLTFAYADVLIRYGVNLEFFLYNPTGAMRLLLASELRLSAVERDSILHVLKGLYEERLAEVDAELRSLPPGRARALEALGACRGQAPRRIELCLR